MTSVAVTGLTKRFGASSAAVDGITFEVRSGTFVTLLGPSGCGKTTTLRLIAGLARPDAGEIRVGDRVLSSGSKGVFVPPEKREMGMVFQSYAIWPHMTVFENVAFPLRERRVPQKEIRDRVMSALALVSLTDFAQRPAPLLSGGQQQRVALARALVGNPQVLLLDEPLSNLDARLREQMRFEIRNMQVRLGITTIFVTHDQLEAMTLSDSVIVMNTGRIEQIGSPREVYERPSSRYVMDFLGQVNHLPARIRIVGGTARAAVDGAEIALPDAAGLADGEQAVLAFRAQAITLDPRGPLRGVVTAATYTGGQMEYLVRVGDASIRVAAPPDTEAPVGSTVALAIAPNAIRAWRDATKA
ncbi:MAG TPA: ABC transporter ATP-binding protein [Candidatus Limnocylindria bacterium]|nr:ABC transporter ATP-binding protein [Candidatus Limnocylindria bacterium]